MTLRPTRNVAMVGPPLPSSHPPSPSPLSCNLNPHLYSPLCVQDTRSWRTSLRIKNTGLPDYTEEDRKIQLERLQGLEQEPDNIEGMLWPQRRWWEDRDRIGSRACMFCEGRGEKVRGEGGTTPRPLLAGGSRTTHPHTPSPITHTLLSIHIHPHNSLHPLPSAPLVTPLPSTPAQVSPWSCLGYGVV